MTPDKAVTALPVVRIIGSPNPSAAFPDGLGAGPTSFPETVNYHLWAPCNMRCHFCFAPFHDVRSLLPRGHLSREEAIEVVQQLASRFRKVSFAGGEPTLCRWLPDLVRTAKDAGACTMLITNGSRLEELMPLLSEHLDWVTLSIDSASSLTLLELGRAVQGTRVIPADRYLELGQAVRGAGMRLKLNTVVTSANVAEDMSGFVATLAPERWKIMRVLPVQGQNSGKVEPFLCSADEFEAFVQRHYHLETDGIRIVPEDNDDMRGSYAMVDPAGRFYDNVSGGYRYTRPILEVGVDAAWSQVAFYMDRFVARGGVYNFAA